jgi:hypothetical protein
MEAPLRIAVDVLLQHARKLAGLGVTVEEG